MSREFDFPPSDLLWPAKKPDYITHGSLIDMQMSSFYTHKLLSDRLETAEKPLRSTTQFLRLSKKKHKEKQRIL